jgi:hypothetical protein
MTCNPNWPEIKEALQHEFVDGTMLQQNSNMRSDIIARVFKQKSEQLIMKNQVFGKTAAYVATIEFQKRGFPQMHILQILDKKDKIISAEHVDDFISAEISDRHEDPVLYELVEQHMIQHPRGYFVFLPYWAHRE